VPYLGDIVAQLERLLGCGDLSVEAKAVSALASAAIAGKQAFIPHFQRSAEGLLALMARTDEEGLSVRAMATDCLGHIAVSIGREAFAPALDESLRLAVEGVHLEHIEVIEYSFSFFGNIAKLLGAELEPLVPQIFDVIKEVVARRDAFIFDHNDDSDDELSRFVSNVEEDAAGLEERHGGAGGEGEEEDPEGEGGDTDDEAARAYAKRNVARVRTSELDAKSGSICCLGQMFEHCGACMGGLLDEAFELVRGMIGYAHENVRSMCIYTMQEVVKCAVQIEGLPAINVDAGETPHVGPQAQHYLDIAFTTLLLRMQEDQVKGVVAQAFEAVRVWCTTIGDAAIANHVDALVEVLSTVLEERLICQYIDSEDEEQDEDDDEDDHDFQLMDTVADLLGGLAAAFGAGFAEDLERLLPLFLRFAKPSRPACDRAMVVGALAEVAQGMGDAVLPFAETMLEVISAGMSGEDGDLSLLRNSSFAVGALLEAGGKAMAPAVPRAVEALLGVASMEGADSAVLDQVCASLARLLLVHGESVSVGAVLPALLGNLPLKDDHNEDGVVYNCLCSLLDAREPTIMGCVPQVLAIMAAALDDYLVADGVKAELVSRLSALAAEFGDATATALAMLPPEHQATLSAHLGLAAPGGGLGGGAPAS